ncbi:nuclear transport factor 2 family protein [Pseudomonas gingeri]|uniref:nuclear transport factor 2 family protein n=1 Tax=Pseudomonas gingeri TaxID=117681 RepID=UPI0015A46F0E|nr:nuclear transport factor 2 family protein [Pseudomonas gingeri]NWD67178.1 nuclear transport factor 2 family protein [Pseudomonas gingeri]
MSTQDLETRLDTLESELAIQRLVAEYGHAFDSHDEALLRSIWHPGALLALGEAFGNFEGIEAIVESAHQNWSQMPHMHHWMANTLIDLDGDKATAKVAVDCLVTHVDMGPTQISGLYHDRLERREGRWAFVERRFELHYLTPLAHWKPVAGSELLAH